MTPPGQGGRGGSPHWSSCDRLSGKAWQRRSTRCCRADAELERIVAEVPALAAGLVKTRRHGDYRLAQVLVAKGDVMLVDFEGEAQRPLAQRRAKGLALVDIADMLRSFDHAAWTSVFRFTEADPVAFDQLLLGCPGLARRRPRRFPRGVPRRRSAGCAELARRSGGRAAAPAMSPGAPVRGGDAGGGKAARHATRTGARSAGDRATARAGVALEEVGEIGTAEN